MAKKLFFTLICLAIILAPFRVNVYAQSPQPKLTEYKLLEPLPGITTNNNNVSTNAGNYINGLFRLILAIAGVLAVVRLIYAGIIYMSTDAINKKSEAKGIIGDALLGLLLASSAWVIVNTINPKALNLTLSLETTPIPAPTNTPGGGTTGTGASTLTQAEVASQFQSAGVGVAGGIQLKGLQQGTINTIVSLKQECNCDVTVTSATGDGHNEGTYSHANGYKVDLRLSPSLSSYITSNYNYLGLRSDGAKQYGASSGIVYALESDHWDVLVR